LEELYFLSQNGITAMVDLALLTNLSILTWHNRITSSAVPLQDQTELVS
jgi:hypothetical protein